MIILHSQTCPDRPPHNYMTTRKITSLLKGSPKEKLFPLVMNALLVYGLLSKLDSVFFYCDQICSLFMYVVEYYYQISLY